VIDVSFNRGQVFEMIVDTGASNTVITPQMAQALGVQPSAVQRFDTATAQGIELGVGQVAEISAGGVVAQNMTVAIAGPELPTGLLGHDFFGNYDMTVKRDVIEFRTREEAAPTEVGGLGR
jgi:clan AA aspartic protease (TIGR02281 family)